MKQRISLFVVAGAVAALVLSGCGGGPGTDTMPDDAAMPSLDGTWMFPGFVAMIAGADVTVTVGDGTMPLGTDAPYSLVTQVVAKGTLAAGATGSYMLTLAAGADAISVTLMPGATQVNPAAESIAIGAIKGVIEGAQSGEVMITVANDTMTVTGSFLDALAAAIGGTVPETGLVGCKDAACPAS